MEKKRIVIAGIGTEIGKTIISSIVCEALKADYWKPIQAGELDNSDTMKVASLVSNTVTEFHQEAFILNSPMSPHAAAKKDNILISLEDLKIPNTYNRIIIEMAGGLMVPINNEELFIDFISRHDLEVILVSNYYLGSINHTLLSLEILKNRNISTLGIIFNGRKVKSTFDVIMSQTSVPCLLEVDHIHKFNKEVIRDYASKLKYSL